jgi:hypothetical protein
VPDRVAVEDRAPRHTPVSETAVAGTAPDRPGSGSGWKVEARLPLRPETTAQEIARYPGRLARHEEAQRIAESRAGHEEEDAAHLRLCELRRPGRDCPHPAHVDARRELRSETHLDRRHVKPALKKALAEPSKIERAGWFN